MEISVPVSLLSLGAVMVESGGLSASLPLDAVQQTLRLAEEDVVHGPDGDSIIFDGKAVPLPAAGTRTGPAGAHRSTTKSRFSSAVIIRAGTEVAAVGVDASAGHGYGSLAANSGFCRS